MRIHSRVKVLAILLLALSMINAPGLIGSQKGFGVAQGLPTEPFPVTISLGDNERVFLATHTSSKTNGNWIELSGGSTIELPSMSFVYDGPDIVYTRDDVTVTMDSSFIPGLVNYPLSTHRVYKEGDSASAKFWGSTELAGYSVSFMLLRASSLSEIWDVLDEGFLGIIGTLLDSLVWINTVTLDSAGDGTHSFPAPAAGDYILVVAKIDSLNLKFHVYSATALEVVDYTLNVLAASSVEKGENLNIEAALIDAPMDSYIYGFAMIKETSYSGNINLVTTGTIPSTELYLNGELMADGDLFNEFFLGTKDISDLNITLIEELLNKAFDPNEISFAYSTTGSTALSTSSLTTGEYVLLVGVWGDWSSKIVGLSQTTINVLKPYVPPPPPPSKNKKPLAIAGPNQKAWVGGTIYFDGSKSKDPDGMITSWTWSFGDGNTATGSEAQHTYFEPGDYEVTLIVMDNRGAEDTDTCKVTVFEPPTGVEFEFSHVIPGLSRRHFVDASEATGTTITLNTTDQVTVTILKFDDNPHPGDPIPATAIQLYVDVMVSASEAVEWPIYVEMFYTDGDVEGLDEASLGIYYWMDGAWQRCSDTGVDTERNVVWAYMTAEEASGSPILMGGMPTIPIPPLPPILSNLIITPDEIERGDNITIGVDIENIDTQSFTYIVTIHIENVNDPPPTVPPYGITLTIYVELGAYESKTVSRALTMDTVGDFNVTVDGLTGSFTVGTWPPGPPPSPAEFVVSDLSIKPEEAEHWVDIDYTTFETTFKITASITNVGEQEGTHTVDLEVYGVVVDRKTVKLRGGEETIIVYEVTKGVGSYTVEVAGLTGSFEVKAPSEPEFEVSDLTIMPEEIDLGDEVTVSFVITNAESGSHIFMTIVQIGDTTIREGVTLEGHESRTVSHSITPESAGGYLATIEGLEGRFTVKPTPTIPVWMRPGTIGGITIIIIAAATILYAYWKGKLPLSALR